MRIKRIKAEGLVGNSEAKIEEIEQEVLAAFEKLKTKTKWLPTSLRLDVLDSCTNQIVEFYQITGQTEKVDEWKAKLNGNGGNATEEK